MELTAQALAALLNHPVESFAKEELGLFSSKVSRLTVNPKHPSRSTRYICKEPHPERGDRVGESFAMEARFYAEVASMLQIRLPRCHAAQEDFIMLEEVGYLPFNWHSGATERHSQCAMAALHVLHQTAHADQLTWIPAFADADFRASLAARFTDSWEANRAALCKWCPDFQSTGEHLKSRIGDYYAALASPAVLLHGDAHLENVPLTTIAEDAADDRVVFFDWQGPRRGHPLFDVAYFNVMSFPTDIRRAREAALVERYLGHVPDFDERTAYRFGIAARACAIVEMTAGWSRRQLGDPGLGWVAHRCFTAALDHQVVELLD
ncbi:MAG: phosphotransferase [Gammaproteobacteria bacterium]|nr:phosphotransferase [Gammaproteobacteria bacterium]